MTNNSLITDEQIVEMNAFFYQNYCLPYAEKNFEVETTYGEYGKKIYLIRTKFKEFKENKEFFSQFFDFNIRPLEISRTHGNFNDKTEDREELSH